VGSFKIEIDIDRDAPKVFAALSDVRTMPVWYEAVREVVALTPDREGQGAKYEIRRHLPGGPVRNEVVVAEYSPNRLFTIESLSGPTPFRYRYTLEPVGDKTRLHLDGEITGEGLPGPLGHIGPLATQLFKRGMGDNLEKLRRLIEGA
jgi:uncharacterized protein YndB with AHSA1/START domain